MTTEQTPRQLRTERRQADRLIKRAARRRDIASTEEAKREHYQTLREGGHSASCVTGQVYRFASCSCMESS